MSEKNPWKRLSSRIVYENQWIRVREDNVIRPDGKEGIYGVVETRIAAGVVAVDDDLNVYLVGQYRYPLDEYSWEIIEGGSDGAETALAAAQRELREEAGLIADRWEKLGADVHLSNCHSSEVAVLFIAQGLHHTQTAPEATEVLRIRKIPFAESVRMAENGDIKDAMTLIGLERAARFLRAFRTPAAQGS